MKYIVLDVETPNSKNDCICSIGVQLIDDDKIVDEWYTLVDPEDIFEDFNVSIHHIKPHMVEGAPKFEEIWNKILCQSHGRVFVAHNAEFDLTVLAKALSNRKLPLPEMNYICTVDLARRIHYNYENVKGDLVLSNLSKNLGVELEEHHNALFDTRACAGILLRLMEIYDFNPADYVHKFRYPKIKQHRYNHKFGCKPSTDNISKIAKNG